MKKAMTEQTASIEVETPEVVSQPNPEPVMEAAPVSELTSPANDAPTLTEARAMFDENPGLSSVLTTEGFLYRDGSLTPV